MVTLMMLAGFSILSCFAAAGLIFSTQTPGVQAAARNDTDVLA